MECVYYSFYFSIDATEESGRLGRLINHKRGGNCEPKVVQLRDHSRVIFKARQKIKKNEELRYDYSDRRKQSLDMFPWLNDI